MEAQVVTVRVRAPLERHAKLGNANYTGVAGKSGNWDDRGQEVLIRLIEHQ